MISELIVSSKVLSFIPPLPTRLMVFTELELKRGRQLSYCVSYYRLRDEIPKSACSPFDPYA